ncbi:hypothetical protein [Actinokineospora sp. NBRC 105648]|uniref:hypothetical protein n=1 Tax=Actinokineospora sp. NBRC 105648 TaxID=3032206 RepID=UPI0024A43D31|nr:hypothetical protein [Actinokineospora sp. NBRC 105648]GLZ37936.1 hypothetical protein Acsp05_15600 [Actinokineospora sp. NBRC 105648]
MTEFTPAAAPLTDDNRVAFELSTTPVPVRVSPGTGDAEYAKLTFVATVTGSGRVTLNEITVKLPAGANSHQLATSLDGVEATVNRPRWAYTGMEQSTFSFRPSSGSEAVDPGASLTITLDRIPVNRAIGSAQVAVTAHWDNESGTGSTFFEVSKFPQGFYVKDFIPAPAQVNNGGDVELRWQASAGATLHLLWEGVQYDVTGRSEFTVTDMRRTTVFYLRATHGTAEQTLGAVVGVPDPDIEVNNLVVTGDLRTDRMETRTLDRIRITRPPDLDTAASAEFDTPVRASDPQEA